MRVYAISDLHGYLPEIPECELLLLGGDYCATRNIDQQRRFMLGDFNDWLKHIPAKYKVGIAGNYDFIFQEDPGVNEHLAWIYLQDNLINLEGITIFGSPWTNPFRDWAFMKSDYELREVYTRIPKGLDILLTHGPAYRHLDKTAFRTHVGSMSLLERIQDVKPDSHVFGHIHEARGIMENENTRFFNVSYVDLLNDPKYTVVNIPLRAQ